MTLPAEPPPSPDRDPEETADALTYGSYLHLDELLDLQILQSDPPHPEELHFIVVHQALELWFKLLLHDLERTIGCLDDDDWPAALGLLRRINDVMGTGLGQMRSLHAMPPWSLQQFRSYLGTASGLQSVQFRELELLSGLREPAHLNALRGFGGGELLPVLERRLAQRSLAEAFADAAARLGIADWADFYVDPGPHGAFYVLCEALVDYDDRWVRWRHEHILLVERTLGARVRGTAGTAITYLERTARYRYFPQLLELRNDLSVRGGGELVGRGGADG
jgi:tryptophan 2,3-dioxygenase